MVGLQGCPQPHHVKGVLVIAGLPVSTTDPILGPSSWVMCRLPKDPGGGIFKGLTNRLIPKQLRALQSPRHPLPGQRGMGGGSVTHPPPGGCVGDSSFFFRAVASDSVKPNPLNLLRPFSHTCSGKHDGISFFPFPFGSGVWQVSGLSSDRFSGLSNRHAT